MNRKQLQYSDDSDSSDESSGKPVRGLAFIPSKIEQIRVAESYRMKGRDQEIEEENKTKRLEPVRKTSEEVKPHKGRRLVDSDEEEQKKVLNQKPKQEVNIYKKPQPMPQPLLRNQVSNFSSSSDQDSEVVQKGSKDQAPKTFGIIPKKKNQPLRGSVIESSDDDEKQPIKKVPFKNSGQAVKCEFSSSDDHDDDDQYRSKEESRNIRQIMEQKAKQAVPLESSLSIKPSRLKQDSKLVYNSKPYGYQSKVEVDHQYASSDSDYEPFDTAKTLKKKEDAVRPSPEEVKMPPSIPCQISQEGTAFSSINQLSSSRSTKEIRFTEYSGPWAENTCYQISHLVKNYKCGEGLLILMCEHVIRECDLKIYQVKPGVVKCPICNQLTILGNVDLLRVKNQKMLRNLIKIKDFSMRQNQCQIESCMNSKDPKYAYIIGKNKIICRDCIFKREGQKLNWITMDHLPDKIENEFRQHQGFFRSRAQLLAKQREKIRATIQDLKQFSHTQNKVLSHKMLELQGKIDKNLNIELQRLSKGKTELLSELKQAQANLAKHLKSLQTQRNQLRGILSQLRRPPREISSQVKVSLQVKGKIEKCHSLVSENMEEVHKYYPPQLKEELNYEGLVQYKVVPHQIEVDEAIWGKYVGDLDTTAKSYEVFKKKKEKIEGSYS